MTDVFEPYSKRKRQLERSEKPVVYQYDDFDDGFRVQAYYALRAVVGCFDASQRVGYYAPNRFWRRIDERTRVEAGRMDLSPREPTPEKKWLAYIRGLSEPDLIIDALEIGFFTLLELTAADPYARADDVGKAMSAVAELNRRFREHDLGYEFVAAGGKGMIVKLDSQYVHAEVVEPAIGSLYAAGFSGPLDEFMEAHRKYRHGDNKGAMTDAHKAFESTMKAIFAARGWPHDPAGNASKLVPVVFDNDLVPRSLEGYFGGVRAIFGSGVPTMRNKMSGHGQGAEVVDLPEHFAAFAIHLSASNIHFLMKCYEALPPLAK